MLINELLTLMDRETEMLTEENNHSASILMRAGAAMIRKLAADASKGAIPPMPPPRN